MARADEARLVQAIAAAARPLEGGRRDYDALIDRIGDARLVLLGEASHGTHEFYRERGQITKRLIADRGFTAVAVEADWPDAYRVNRFVRGQGADRDPASALADFRRFPHWTWRNADVLDFVGWLRAHNDGRARETRPVGFYGLDLYSLHASIAAVLRYLDRVDPAAARWARARYACFDEVGEEPERLALTGSCEDEAVSQLLELQRRRAELLQHDGLVAEDELFQAEQNARLVKNAEEYYRSMFLGRVATWNLRDTHMADTLDGLAAHLERTGPAKLVVWAHNSHLGDTRFTEMGKAGEVNLGQLVRERHPQACVAVGFTTDHGTVSAASDWGAPVERKSVRPGWPGSYESFFHAVRIPRFLLLFGGPDTASAGLAIPRLERAIGVIYRPETERTSHYFLAALRYQFDAILHLDETRAVEPLERTGVWDAGELPETYPAGV